jgi:hypothetical protein
MSPSGNEEFSRLAGERAAPTLLGDLWLFLKQTGKWWLLPILALLLLLAFLLMASSGAAAPFIYTLF